MPHFFFHVRNGGGDIGHDTEGQELPDLAAAQCEAINTNREMLGEKLLHGGAHHRQIEIANEHGEVLAVVNASEVVLVKGGQLRAFKDDVTKSAPTPGPTPSKARSR